MGINKVILVGNVGKDPEIRRTESGNTVASFSLATSETYKKDGQKKTVTEWHNIVMWRWLAEVAEKYVKKGSKLYLDGRVKSRSWQDKDGNTRYITEIVADKMEMLDSKDSGQNNTPKKNAQQNTTPNATNTDEGEAPLPEEDDLPF